MPTRLNTTDFAILGLLARRPWSAYELTQYMRTSNVRAVWPRAESRIYESPKKLAKLGFARAAVEQAGKRSRSVYSITPEGEAALAHWLSEDSRPFGFEYESLLKLALGDITDQTDRERQLSRLARESADDWAQMAAFFEEFGEGAFNTDIDADHLTQNLFVNSFIREILRARQRWSRFAVDLETKFAGCESEEEKLALVRESYRQLLRD